LKRRGRINITGEEFRQGTSRKLILIGLIALISTSIGTFSITYFSSVTPLQNDYDELLNNYQIITGDYNTLYDNYDDLLNDYNSICSFIEQQILPFQYSAFAEAARRHYMPQYLDGKTNKTFWKSFTEFCRNIILHDSHKRNSFYEVSNAFDDALIFGSDTMHLCFQIMYETFYDWLPNWDGRGLTLNEITDIDTIIQWCIDEIEYEYDHDITEGDYDLEIQYLYYDYIKFSPETAFRTMGDCEDQAILAATYLESCGFNTAIAIFHDPSHPTLGSFYHGVPLVHIENTSAFFSNYPSTSLWRFGSSDPYYPDYTWCFLDPTWDVPFGSEPSWLTDYSSLNFDIFSIAFCYYGGAVL
jgi:hypothetical protein